MTREANGTRRRHPSSPGPSEYESGKASKYARRPSWSTRDVSPRPAGRPASHDTQGEDQNGQAASPGAGTPRFAVSGLEERALATLAASARAAGLRQPPEVECPKREYGTHSGPYSILQTARGSFTRALLERVSKAVRSYTRLAGPSTGPPAGPPGSSSAEPSIPTTMPDLNYVLEHDPEQANDAGWWAFIGWEEDPKSFGEPWATNAQIQEDLGGENDIGPTTWSKAQAWLREQAGPIEHTDPSKLRGEDQINYIKQLETDFDRMRYSLVMAEPGQPWQYQLKNGVVWKIYRKDHLGHRHSTDGDQVRALVSPVIQNYPGGWQALLDDIEMFSEVKPGSTNDTIADAYQRFKMVVGEHYDGDIFAFITLFNEYCRGLQEAWDLEQQFRQSKTSRIAAEEGLLRLDQIQADATTWGEVAEYCDPDLALFRPGMIGVDELENVPDTGDEHGENTRNWPQYPAYQKNPGSFPPIIVTDSGSAWVRIVDGWHRANMAYLEWDQNEGPWEIPCYWLICRGEGDDGSDPDDHFSKTAGEFFKFNAEGPDMIGGRFSYLVDENGQIIPGYPGEHHDDVYARVFKRKPFENQRGPYWDDHFTTMGQGDLNVVHDPDMDHTSWNNTETEFFGNKIRDEDVIAAHKPIWDAWLASSPEFNRNGMFVNEDVATKQAKQASLATAARKTARRRPLRFGFYKLAADITELADKALTRLRQRDDIKKLENDPAPVAAKVREFLMMIENGQIGPESYKLWEWAVGQIKRDHGIRTLNHVGDILEQAAKWMAWADEYHKPTPDWKRRDFTFINMEQWVRDMETEERQRQGISQWQDERKIYEFDDGWYMSEVSANDCSLEGELMGHCVGGYAQQINAGESYIVSLRDPRGQPHVTLEMYGTKPAPAIQGPYVPEWEVIQIQGKSDSDPIPEYKEKVKEWFNSLKNEGYDIRWGENSDQHDYYDGEPHYDYENQVVVKVEKLSDVPEALEAIDNEGLGSFQEDNYTGEYHTEDRGHDHDYDISGVQDRHEIVAPANYVDVEGGYAGLTGLWREFIQEVLHEQIPKEQIEEYCHGFYMIALADENNGQHTYGGPDGKGAYINLNRQIEPWIEEAELALKQGEESYAAEQQAHERAQQLQAEQTGQEYLFNPAELFGAPTQNGRALVQYAINYMKAIFTGFTVTHPEHTYQQNGQSITRPAFDSQQRYTDLYSIKQNPINIPVPLPPEPEVPGTFAKTAMPYHVAPRDRREKIEQEGLRTQEQNHAGSPSDPDGIYYWDTPDQAHFFGDRFIDDSDGNNPYDVWQFDLEPHEQPEDDPWFDGFSPEDAYEPGSIGPFFNEDESLGGHFLPDVHEISPDRLRRQSMPYHVSPRSNREEIEQSGLEDVTGAGGLFYWDTPEQAQDYWEWLTSLWSKDFNSWSGEQVPEADVWEFDMPTDAESQPDDFLREDILQSGQDMSPFLTNPEDPDSFGAGFARGVERIPPEELRRHAADEQQEPSAEPEFDRASFPPDVLQAFGEIANQQRGIPERAMLDVQRVYGGGVGAHAAEHIGDLTHRMNEWASMPYAHVGPASGREFFEPKVERMHRLLHHPYGFEQELEENIASNASFRDQDEDELRQQVYDALDKYAAAHAALPVYNRAQYLAREAAVSLGQQNYAATRSFLSALKRLIASPDYIAQVTDYRRDAEGRLLQYGDRDRAAKLAEVAEPQTQQTQQTKMPNLNYVLDYNPEDEPGWKAVVWGPGHDFVWKNTDGDMRRKLEDNCFSPYPITWQQAQQFLMEHANAKICWKQREEIMNATPEQEFITRWDSPYYSDDILGHLWTEWRIEKVESGTTSKFAVELLEAPSIQMPDTNYVLDYNPEDVREAGWFGTHYSSSDTWPAPGHSKDTVHNVTWEQARTYLLTGEGAQNGFTPWRPPMPGASEHALRAATPNEPFRYGHETKSNGTIWTIIDREQKLSKLARDWEELDHAEKSQADYDRAWPHRIPFFAYPNGAFEMGTPGDDHEMIDPADPVGRYYSEGDVPTEGASGDHQGSVLIHPELGEIYAWPQNNNTLEPHPWLTDDLKQRIAAKARERYQEWGPADADDDWRYMSHTAGAAGDPKRFVSSSLTGLAQTPDRPPGRASWIKAPANSPVKTAALEKVWHQSGYPNRESIRRHGLNWELGNPEYRLQNDDSYDEEGNAEEWPRGQYFWTSYEEALGNTSGEDDIWEVDARGLDLQPDPYLGGIHSAAVVYTTEPISPDRLTLVHEGDGPMPQWQPTVSNYEEGPEFQGVDENIRLFPDEQNDYIRQRWPDLTISDCPVCDDNAVVPTNLGPHCLSCGWWERNPPRTKRAAHDEEWPLHYEHGQWIFEWNGGRLMDIRHRNNPTMTVHAIPPVPYDWQKSAPMTSGDPMAEMKEAADAWAESPEADEYEENVVPYLQHDEEGDAMLGMDYPDDVFPQDWTLKPEGPDDDSSY